MDVTQTLGVFAIAMVVFPALAAGVFRLVERSLPPAEKRPVDSSGDWQFGIHTEAF